MIRSFHLKYWSLATLLLTLLVSIGIDSTIKSARVLAQTIFPDVAEDYWASPFIQRLAERNIVTGYPDGEFKPQQPIQRDEFAAILRQAFDQPQEREISSASIFEDVPENYWAETPITEAYEAGFMERTSENTFSPNDSISKAEAVVILTDGLDLTPSDRPVADQRLMFPFPFASTVIMAPFMRLGMPLASAAITGPWVNRNVVPTQPTEISASETLNRYYEDADLIPENKVDNLAIATKQGIVVNYPNPKYLQPNEPLQRSEAAALIHQALVSMDRLPPLSAETKAFNYIVLPANN